MKFEKGSSPWNKGLTKETDERVKKNGEKTSQTKRENGVIPWNLGLTKETDERVRSATEHMNGKIVSIEVREKIKNTLKGKHISPETEFKKGYKPTKETLIKLSIINSKEGHPNWQGGITSLPYCHKWTKEFREDVRNRDEHVCQNCGITQKEHKLKTRKILTVHHIHYLKLDCEPDCITLCISCNIKANHNKNYWEELFMNKLNDRQLLFWTKLRK